jgi:hypothetical protein
MEDAYNSDVEAFREEEYPMLKGKTQSRDYGSYLISLHRCCVP